MTDIVERLRAAAPHMVGSCEMIVLAADEITRLRAEVERLTLGRETMGNLWAREKEARVAAETEAITLRAENERMREALEQIAGKNDLSDATDNEVEAHARAALFDCELIARAALTEPPHD